MTVIKFLTNVYFYIKMIDIRLVINGLIEQYITIESINQLYNQQVIVINYLLLLLNSP